MKRKRSIQGCRQRFRSLEFFSLARSVLCGSLLAAKCFRAHDKVTLSPLTQSPPAPAATPRSASCARREPPSTWCSPTFTCQVRDERERRKSTVLFPRPRRQKERKSATFDLDPTTSERKELLRSAVPPTPHAHTIPFQSIPL